MAAFIVVAVVAVGAWGAALATKPDSELKRTPSHRRGDIGNRVDASIIIENNEVR